MVVDGDTDELCQKIKNKFMFCGAVCFLEPTCFLEMRDLDYLTAKTEVQTAKYDCPEVTNDWNGII